MKLTSSTSFSVACLLSEPTNNLYSTAPNTEGNNIRSRKFITHEVNKKATTLISHKKYTIQPVKKFPHGKMPQPRLEPFKTLLQGWSGGMAKKATALRPQNLQFFRGPKFLCPCIYRVFYMKSKSSLIYYKRPIFIVYTQKGPLK